MNEGRKCAGGWWKLGIILGWILLKTIKFKVLHNKTLVFPEPGPAVKNSGPYTVLIACSCFLFGLNPDFFQRYSNVSFF